MAVDGKFGHVTLEYQPGVPIPDDIPCFVLLARDRAALSTLIDYQHHAEAAGMPPVGLAMVEGAISRFAQWRRDHPDEMKTPSITMREPPV